MFAIYSAAVMSLNHDERKQRLCESRKTLLSRYMRATKSALLRAKFMGTTSLVVLQALVLHLLSVRDFYEPRAVWSWTGVAVRIAQSMGLDRDGVFSGLSPFETEMRRRVCTKKPTNVNDDQLNPGIPSLLAESKSLTDIAFVALRYELANFSANRVAKFRQQGKSPSQWERDLALGGDKEEMGEAFREIEGRVGNEVPTILCSFTAVAPHDNAIPWASIEQTPLSERQWIWEVSIKLLEQHNMLQSNPQLKRFAWHAAFVMQWHAFIHVLDTLRSNPLNADAEKAWELIGNTCA
ncbi:hypothetical protein V1523DRAFT_435087 [Lipomyces doorenjongii]